MKTVELLSPAGSPDAAIAAINAGADAIYIAGKRFGARAYAKNTTEDSLISTIEYAHIHGSKVFLTLNTLLKNQEIKEELYDFLLPIYEAGLDAVIVQDLGVVSFLQKNFPLLPIHCSTQMTISNLEGAKLMKELGAERVVLSRELSLDEIKDITDAGIETECFIHGALCYCYSGACLFSSIIGGRSGNRGRCAQPCRLPYKVDGKKKYILSPKDLCTIEHLPELIEAGIYSFKIEGRMKRAEYTAAVTSIYRKYIDLALECLRTGKDYKVSKEDYRILLDAGNRNGFTDGYYNKHNGRDMISYDKPDYDTGGDNFFEYYAKEYLEKKKKENLKGKLILLKGKSAKLVLEYKDISLQLEGALVSESIKAPLDEDRIRKQMNKTGDSAFSFSKLDIVMDSDIFMPIQDVNELRRRGILELSECILDKYRRERLEGKVLVFKDYLRENSNKAKTKTDIKLRLYIESLSYLNELMELDDLSQIDRIYLNSSCFKLPFNMREIEAVADAIRGRGIECFFVLPHVFRKRNYKEFDKLMPLLEECFGGILLRNIDELGFVKSHSYKGRLVADYSLYAYNNLSYESLRKQGVDELCAPVELSYKELKGFGYSFDEAYAYGYLPLMTSAQCVRNTCKGCDKSNSRTFITDRYNKNFVVKSFCDYCYSVVYNANPLTLLDKQDELAKIGVGHLRLSFTNEKPGKVKAILGAFRDKKDIPSGDFTRGHWNRGVE